MGELNSRIEGLKSQLALVHAEVLISSDSSLKTLSVSGYSRLNYPGQNCRKQQKRVCVKEPAWMSCKYGSKMIKRCVVLRDILFALRRVSEQKFELIQIASIPQNASICRVPNDLDSIHSSVQDRNWNQNKKFSFPTFS